MRGLSSTELPQHNRVGTTPGDEEGVPANAYIYVFVLWGGAVRKQQHIFLQVAQLASQHLPLQVGRSYHQIKVVKHRKTWYNKYINLCVIIFLNTNYFEIILDFWCKRRVISPFYKNCKTIYCLLKHHFYNEESRRVPTFFLFISIWKNANRCV